MNPERWSRLRSVVEQALDAGTGAQHVISASFADDAELQEMARSLVDRSQESGAGGLALESPCPGAAAAMVSTLAASELLGRRFGPYRAIGLIGEGAMGTVYLAVRADESFDRQVAVKVLKGALGDRESRRRFDQERRLLAKLEHAGICRLLDGGTTDDGLAYIVMEHVEGEPLSQWLRSRAGGAEGGGTHARHERRARVELFTRVCEAVACAHQAGIVHRDLKPTNILVQAGKAGEPPLPKIIDFGIARVIDSDLTTCVSSESRLLGTLPYMAPEQIDGSASGANARADVYSLGVILYELLAGRPPLDVKSTGVPEALRRIREEEPTRLGTLDRSLRGDLDTIVAKAMEKDPRRRYGSAAELAADLRRWLIDQPIVARRPSPLYQASKFARRHRTLVIAAVAVFLALSGAVVAVSAALVRVERQSQRAREVNAFMRGLLASADPFSVPAGPRTVASGIGIVAPAVQAGDMLAAAEKWLAEHPIDDPLVEADIRDALGVSCSGLGRHDAAVSQLERALTLRTRRLGAGAVPTLECAGHLATALTRAGSLERADALHRAAIAGLARALGESDPSVLRARFELTMCLIHESKFEESAALAGGVERAARAEGEDSIAALAAGLRAVSVIYSSDEVEGQRLAEAALADIGRTCGQDHYVAALITCTLGGLAESRNDLEEAERRYRSAADSYARLLGERDPRTASRLVSLGRVLDGLGRFGEAEDPLRRAVASEAVGTPLARQIADQARAELAVCLRAQGRGPEASALTTGPK